MPPTKALGARNFTESFTQSNGGNRGRGTGGFCRFCIQDNDPRTVYSGSWLLRGTTFNTTHSTTQTGAKVTLTFNGMKIMVLGTVPASNATVKPPTARYTISGRDPVQSTLPMANTEIRGQSFFRAMDLEEEEHTLTIEIVDAQTPYTLDSFFVTPHAFSQNRTEDSDTTSSTSPLPTSGTDPNSGPSPPLFTPNPYMNDTVSQLPSQEGSSNIVAILSGLVGVLLAVIVIGIALFLTRRKRKASNPNTSFFSKSWHWRTSHRPDTVYTSWTTPESIQRNEPSWLLRGSSAFTPSEGPPSDLRVSTIDQRFPQLPQPTLSKPNA
ncbi:hypothetical protein BKA70DRAFT_1246248 [Coprinopsis sp. MPI-PUGE-AT-0042]|nr:hypothetical protein BKA70DRAFT_1246248 [Coprinopsis sp. MPI-PUGE-AT-0042]